MDFERIIINCSNFRYKYTYWKYCLNPHDCSWFKNWFFFIVWKKYEVFIIIHIDTWEYYCSENVLSMYYKAMFNLYYPNENTSFSIYIFSQYSFVWIERRKIKYIVSLLRVTVRNWRIFDQFVVGNGFRPELVVEFPA